MFSQNFDLENKNCLDAPSFKQATMMAFSNPHELEYEINDLPIITMNYLILKGITQNEISEFSGALVCTRGQHVSPHSKSQLPFGQKPLHFYIQGPSQQSVELAVKLIEKLINEAEDPEINGGVEIVPISCENVPQTYNLADKIMGPGGTNLQYITNQSGALVTLRGQGSGFLEPLTNQESSEPIHIRLQHKSPEVLKRAKQLAKHLVKTIKDEINALLAKSQITYQFSKFQAGTNQLNVNPLPSVDAVIEAPPQLLKNVVTPIQLSSKTQSQAPLKQTQMPPLLSNREFLSSIPIPKQTLFQSPGIVKTQQSTVLTTKLNFPLTNYKNVQPSKSELSIKLDSEIPSINEKPIPKCNELLSSYSNSSSTLLDNSTKDPLHLNKQLSPILSAQKSIPPSSNTLPVEQLQKTRSNEELKLSPPFTPKASLVLSKSSENKKEGSKKSSGKNSAEARKSSDKRTYAHSTRTDRDRSYDSRKQNYYDSDSTKQRDSYYDKRNRSSQSKRSHSNRDNDRDSVERRRKLSRFSNANEKSPTERKRKFSRFSNVDEKDTTEGQRKLSRFSNVDEKDKTERHKTLGRFSSTTNEKGNGAESSKIDQDKSLQGPSLKSSASFSKTNTQSPSKTNSTLKKIQFSILSSTKKTSILPFSVLTTASQHKGSSDVDSSPEGLSKAQVFEVDSNNSQSQLVKVLDTLKQYLQSYTDVTSGEHKSQLTKILQLLEQLLPIIKCGDKASSKAQLLLILKLLEKAIPTDSADSHKQSIHLLQTIQILSKLMEPVPGSPRKEKKNEERVSITKPDDKEKILQKPSSLENTLKAQETTQLRNIVLLLQKSLKTYSDSLKESKHKTEINQVTQLIKHLLPTINPDSTLKTSEQRSHILTIVQLLEKTLLTAGSSANTQLTHLLQIIKKALLDQTSKSATVPDQIKVDGCTHGTVITAKECSLQHDKVDESDSHIQKHQSLLAKDKNSANLIEIFKLLQNALQEYLESMQSGKEKSQMKQIIKLMRHAFPTNTVITDEQKSTLSVILQLCGKALQTQKTSMPSEVLLIIQALKKQVESSSSVILSQSTQQEVTQSNLSDDTQQSFQPTVNVSKAISPSVSTTSIQPQPHLIVLMQLLLNATQAHADTITSEQQKLQLIPIIQMLQTLISFQAGRVTSSQLQIQIILIMQLLQEVIQTQGDNTSAGQQPIHLMQTMQLILQIMVQIPVNSATTPHLRALTPTAPTAAGPLSTEQTTQLLQHGSTGSPSPSNDHLLRQLQSTTCTHPNNSEQIQLTNVLQQLMKLQPPEDLFTHSASGQVASTSTDLQLSQLAQVNRQFKNVLELSNVGLLQPQPTPMSDSSQQMTNELPTLLQLMQQLQDISKSALKIAQCIV